MTKFSNSISIIKSLFLILMISSCSNKTKLNETLPQELKLRKGTVKKIWIPDQVEESGRVFIPGHYKYLYEEDVRWTK